MQDNARSQSHDSGEASAFREALHGRAEYMQYKFDARQADDIKPRYLQETLNELGKLAELCYVTQRPVVRKIQDLEDHIYAANSLYKEPENRSKYFAELRVIADLLKRI